MVPVFLEKGMKCVNAAPVRGVSAVLFFPLFVRSHFSLTFFFAGFNGGRNGEGHFRHRGKQPDCEETKDPVGQKYRLRERYLRHQREKGHFPVRPAAPGNHSGIFKGKHVRICCY